MHNLLAILGVIFVIAFQIFIIYIIKSCVKSSFTSDINDYKDKISDLSGIKCQIVSIGWANIRGFFYGKLYFIDNGIVLQYREKAIFVDDFSTVELSSKLWKRLTMGKNKVIVALGSKEYDYVKILLEEKINV